MLALTRRVSSGIGIATGRVAGAAGINTKKQATALDEQIKGVQDRLDNAHQTFSDAMARIAAAQAETDRLAGLVRERAAAVYRRATRGGDDSLFQTDVQLGKPYYQGAVRLG